MLKSSTSGSLKYGQVHQKIGKSWKKGVAEVFLQSFWISDLVQFNSIAYC